jgi:hypothetical protein
MHRGGPTAVAKQFKGEIELDIRESASVEQHLAAALARD